ncbi:uroporphyrinogen decarboxylase family protein [Treponema endosymbiont of Eucomonympha sp.]|uniref:uroporphyrinogen decarboxylase family protein n=1 Tax=Treponema endosymbiont of Eucomonympha sp. TaxID=1580831 RepID=UPI000783EBAF|nr:uroporphyrinogen decarboxylase family protein [Treponema endosymbiont of Eucomonympha sp.]
MTNKELVVRALNNQPVERVPVGFWFHFLPQEDKADALKDPAVFERNIAGHRKFIECFRPDLVKIMSDGFFRYPAAGEIAGIHDLAKLQAVDVGCEWVQKQVSLVKQVVSLQANTCYFYNVFSPATTLKFLLGQDALLRYIKTDFALVSEALQRVAAGLAAQAECAVVQGGADGVYLSVQNPDSTAISDEDYRRYIYPADKIVLDAANRVSENNILHICGYAGCRNRLPAWTDYRAKAYNWAVGVEGVPFAEGKKLFGGSAVIGGFANTAQSVLYKGTKAEIEAETERLLRCAGTTGIILGADCTLPLDISFERLEWVRTKAAALDASRTGNDRVS